MFKKKTRIQVTIIVYVSYSFYAIYYLYLTFRILLTYEIAVNLFKLRNKPIMIDNKKQRAYYIKIEIDDTVVIYSNISKSN